MQIIFIQFSLLFFIFFTSFRFSIDISVGLIILLFILLGISLQVNRKHPYHLYQYIQSTVITRYQLIITFSLLITFLLIYYLIPSHSILLQKKIDDTTISYPIAEQTVNITPSKIPPEWLKDQEHYISFEHTFYLSEKLEKQTFFLSAGKGKWWIDENEIAYHQANDADRHLVIFKDLYPGIHSIKFEGYIDNIFPSLSYSGSTSSNGVNQLIKLSKNDIDYESILLILLIVAFITILPLINLIAQSLEPNFNSFTIVLSIFLLILCFIMIRNSLHPIVANYFEADEAAFGLMAQSVLFGQAPPLFHYGQNYQGTIEAFPLSFLLYFNPNSKFFLHLLPIVWQILFLLILTFCAFYYGNRHIGVFTSIISVLMGSGFYWITSKTWFGYSFCLFLGAILWWIALHSYQKGKISTGLGFFWGIIAALSFYSLPLSIPFVISSLICLLFLYFKQDKWSFIINMSIAFIGLIIFSFPYWISLINSNTINSMELFLEGRSLLAPNNPNEHPLFDRFIQECLPVLLGQNFPYAQQESNLFSSFQRFPTILLIISIILFPFTSKKTLRNTGIFSSFSIQLTLWLLSLFTIIVVTYSPFGIWPWYAIPLYYIIPFILYNFVLFIYKKSPSIAVSIVIVFIYSMIASFHNYSFLYHQPLSLSQQGIYIPTNFDKIIKKLDDNNINYLFSDQGYDTWSEIGGKDWLGESLLYDYNQLIHSVDTLSRRLPLHAQETIKAKRVGFLFHQAYRLDTRTQNSHEIEKPITMETLNQLFGSNLLNYKKIELFPYTFFVPPPEISVFEKEQWIVNSSYPYFMKSAIDHNISVRSSGADVYWSSGPISDDGAWFSVTFPKRNYFSKIILYHGSKVKDHPINSKVFLLDENQLKYEIGSLTYDPISHCSYLKLDYEANSFGILIEVPKQIDQRWFTITELWIQ